jgi:hypothetical protein
MGVCLRISLPVMTVSLLFCGICNGEDQSSGPSASAQDQVSTGQVTPKPAPASGSDWQTDVTLYVWLPGVHGNLGAFGYNLGYKASASDLISHADTPVMGLIGLQYKPVVFIIDSYYAPFSVTNAKVFAQLPGQPVLTGNVNYTQVELTVEGGYRLLDHHKLKIDALTGYRYWHNGVSLNVTTAQRGASAYGSTNYADPLVGGRIVVPLFPKLSATLWGDVGGWGAGAQLDYQMVGALTYKIKPRWGIDAAWRYNYTDYGAIIHSVTAQSGIVIGATYHLTGAE